MKNYIFLIYCFLTTAALPAINEKLNTPISLKDKSSLQYVKNQLNNNCEFYFSTTDSKSFLYLNSLNTEEERIEYLVIGFSEKMNYKLDDDVMWKIKNKNNGMPVKSGVGSITELIFDAPGNYEVEIIEPVNYSHNECSHQLFPNKIMVEVSSVLIKFDLASVKFKNQISVGSLQSDNEVYVDVYFSSIDNQEYAFEQPLLIAVGVDVNITGELIGGKTILKLGINQLTYKLSGIASREAYIMFDFYGINNQITSYRYPTKVK